MIFARQFQKLENSGIGETMCADGDSNLEVFLVKGTNVLLISVKACFCEQFISQKSGFSLSMGISLRNLDHFSN